MERACGSVRVANKRKEGRRGSVRAISFKLVPLVRVNRLCLFRQRLKLIYLNLFSALFLAVMSLRSFLLFLPLFCYFNCFF